MNIRKRDGRIEDFKSEKITKAIAKAFKSLGENISENNLEIITKKVVELINNETPTVEEIQDLVERVLMELNYFEVAKKLHFI